MLIDGIVHVNSLPSNGAISKRMKGSKSSRPSSSYGLLHTCPRAIAVMTAEKVVMSPAASSKCKASVLLSAWTLGAKLISSGNDSS